MSAETAFRALLAGNAELTALVGSRIAQNVVPQGEALPLIVFTVAHTQSRGIDGTLLADEATFTVQCWGEDSLAADAVADAASTALASTADIIARESAFDSEIDLHATVLSVQWWTV
jgi:hypothetical protein